MTKRQLLLTMLICKHLMMFSQYSINGIITDEKGSALTGANIIIQHTFTGTITNSKGEFLIRNVEPGDYNLIVSFLGYETVTKQVIVDKDVTINFMLAHKFYLADEVIVQATRADANTPVATSSVSQEEISSTNMGQDVPYLLALTPSVTATSDGGAGVGYTALRIRGTDMTGINVTINGIPINDAESRLMYWVDLPDIVASADNIQIQRGVGTSTIGSGAFGATINLQTLGLNKKPYAEINNGYGSFNTWRNSVSFGSGLINDHFSFDGRLSKISSDGYIDRAWSDLKSVYLSGSYYSQNTLLKVNAFSGLERTYQAWGGVPRDSLNTHRTFNGLGLYTDDYGKTQYYNNQTDNYQQDHFQMFFSHAFSSSVNINVALHYTKGKGFYEEFQEKESLADYLLDTVFLPKGDTIASTNLIRQKWLDNAFYGFTWSANYSKGSLNAILGGGMNQYFGKHYGKVIWAKYMSNGQIDHQYYYNSGTKNDFNVFAKTTYQIADYLSAFGDLQYRRITHSIRGADEGRNIDQSHEYNFFNPKAGLTFKLGSRQTINAYYGIAHREPTRDDFVDADVSNPVPEAERLNDLEIGYQYHSNVIRLGVNYYYMNYRNQLIHTGKINDVGSAILTNVDKSYRTGTEFTGELSLWKKVNWNMNATFSRNIIEDFVAYTDNYDTWPQQTTENLGNTSIAFSPEIIAGSRISYDISKNISVHFVSKYVGKQYIDNTGSEERKLDPYFLNDFRINMKFKTKYITSIEPTIMVNNIFDVKYETNAWVYQYIESGQRYTQDGYFPQAGINFMVGLALKF